MRLSAIKGDPGYNEFAIATGVRVFLDGIEIKDCVTADEEQGLIVCVDFQTPFTGDEILTIERRGSVRIELSETEGWIAEEIRRIATSQVGG